MIDEQFASDPSTLLHSFRQRAVTLLFGDRVGLTLFLGVVVSLSVCWRVGFYITDTYAVANTVVNVAEGHFDVRRIEYSLTLGSQPGLYRNGAQVFGRNYAAATLAVPLYWLLEFTSILVDLRLAVAAGWSLLAAGFAAQVGRLLDRPSVTAGGSLLASAAFVANVALATPLDPRWTGLLALQLLTLIAAGVVAVCLYRLAALLHGRRVGVAAGVLSAFSLPVAFWATIPKRHVFSAALITIALLAFARSRRPDSSPSVRAGAYAAVGILAWLHAAEALAVFVVLVPIDLLTAPRNDRRTVAVVAGVFALSLLPFLVTNVAVTGNPVETPRMLSSLGDAGQVGPDGRVVVDVGEPTEPPPEPTPEPTTTPSEPPGGTADPGTTAPTAPSEPDGGSSGPITALFGLVEGLLSIAIAAFVAAPDRLGDLWAFVDKGLKIVQNDPERLGHVFVRSGRIPGLRYGVNQQEAIELTVVESAPVLGLLVIAPLIWARRTLDRGRESLRRAPAVVRTTPRYQTDLFAGGIVFVFTLLYLPRLPLFSQITVRYLVPVMPVALYGVIRIPAVRNSIDEHFWQFARTYATASAVGIVGVIAGFVWLQPALGEAMQFHALLNLSVAGLGLLLLVGATVSERPAFGAEAIGAAGGAGTTLFVLAGIEYFTYGPYALPIASWVSELLPLF